jgi:hypothetical protein
MENRIKHVAIVLAIISLAVSRLGAQQNVGSITGTVRDPSGAAVPRAEVVAQRMDTGMQTKTLSTADGTYTVPSLHVGTYALDVTAAGFKTAQVKDLRVVAGEALTMDVSLELGQVTQITRVTAAAPLMDTQTNTLGTTRTVEEIKDLPLEMAGQARTYLGWFLTVPGYAYIPSESWATYNGLTRANINGVGTSQFGNDYYGYNLDGVSGVSFANAGLEDAAAPIPDVVEEFRMSTNPTAESGANLGVQVDLVMKSGTNNFHGTLFEYFRNDHLNARNWFLPIVAPLKQNQYGFTLGGPVSIPKIYNGKNRTFFFASWMGERMRSLPTGSDINGTVTSVPTELMQAGNFSQWIGPQVGTDALGRPVYQGEIYNPATTRTVTLPSGGTAIVRDPFPNNTINTPLSPISQNFAKYIPLPNAPGLQLNYFAFSTPRHTDEDLVMFKIDHQIKETQRLSFSGDILPNKYVNYEAQFPAEINNSECVDQTLQRFRAVYSWIVHPNLLFNFRVGYVRSKWDDRPSLCINTSADYGATAGLTGVLAPYTPAQNITGIAGFGNYWNLFLRIGTHVPINTDMTLTKGTHTFKWGAEFDQQIHLNNESVLTAGMFNFAPLETGLPGFPQTGLGFASYLLGDVNSATLNTPVIVRHLAQRWGLYAQDQWRATSKLTVNYGLRWDIVSPLRESHDYIGSFDPRVPNPAAGGLLGALTFWGTGPGHNGRTGSLYPIYWGAFGPRLGLSYALNDKTVLRGYYGLLYSPMNADFVQGESIPSYGASASVTPTTTNNGVTPAFNWNNGFPDIIPALPSVDPAQLNGSSVSYIGSPSENRPARSQNVGASLERTIPGDVLLRAAYVGTFTHGYRSTDGGPPLDELPLQYLSLGNTLLADINSPEAAAAGIKAPYPGFQGSVAQALRPYPQYTGVNQADSTYGFSIYNALQVTAQKRFKQGLNFLVSYTASKDLVNGSYQALPLLSTRKTLSELDRPQIFNLSYSYQLPFGPGKTYFQNATGLVRQLLAGWQISAIQSYYSGTPVIVSTDASIPAIGGVWANRVPGVPISTGVGCAGYNPGDPNSHILNVNAFATPAPFTFGNTYVLPSIRTCGYKNEDVSVQKSFVFTEHVNLRLGFDFYNIFNRHNWGFASTAGGGGLGGDINQPASFGRYSGASDPRTVQIYLRLEF